MNRSAVPPAHHDRQRRAVRAWAALGAIALLAASAAPPARAIAPAPPPITGARTPMLVLPPAGFRLPDTTITFGASETERCLKCHGLPSFLVRDSLGGPVRDLSVHRDAYARSEHRALACTQCHGDVHQYPHKFEGRRAKVGCDADCHARDANGRVVRHEEQTEEVEHSVHRRGLTDPASDSPSCVYCHGAGDPHAVPRATKSLSPGERLAMCAACHDDRERMARHKVDGLASESYRASLHYAALRFGGRHAPVCEDCHDTHGVRASRDTASTTSALKRAATCGTRDCHAGASARFAASGTSHPTMRVAHSAALALVRRGFEWAGLGVLLALALAVALEAQRRWLGRPPDADHPRIEGPLVPRMSAAVRLQHGALIVSFTLLALTGLPLRFPDSQGMAVLERLFGGFETARAIHRASAVVMALAALAHLTGVFGALVRARFDARTAWPMVPDAQDVRDTWETLRFWLRLRPAPPPYDRHHWREKVHYWAVLWGVPVMIGTGLVLWFAERLAGGLPRGALVAIALAHGDEALLAVAIVIVWHMWVVHVSPGRTHRWLTFLDGRITREYWLTRHAREAERAGALPPAAPAAPAGQPPADPGPVRAAAPPRRS